MAVVGSLLDGGGVTDNENQVLRLVGQRAAGSGQHLDIDEVAMVDSPGSDQLPSSGPSAKNNLTGTEKEYRFGVPLIADGTPRGTVLAGNDNAAGCLG